MNDTARLTLAVAALREDAIDYRRRLAELPANAPEHWRPNILHGWEWTARTWERQTIEGFLPPKGRGAAQDKRRDRVRAEIKASPEFVALVADLVAWGLLVDSPGQGVRAGVDSDP